MVQWINGFDTFPTDGTMPDMHNSMCAKSICNIQSSTLASEPHMQGRNICAHMGNVFICFPPLCEESPNQALNFSLNSLATTSECHRFQVTHIHEQFTKTTPPIALQVVVSKYKAFCEVDSPKQQFMKPQLVRNTHMRRHAIIDMYAPICTAGIAVWLPSMALPSLPICVYASNFISL